MAVKNYRVTARRTGDWWALDVPDVPGVHSQTKRLEQAEQEIREAIALMLDVEEDEFDVTIEPDLPTGMERALHQLQEARKAADAAADLLRVSMSLAATCLTADLSQRDAGFLLDVSFQRVHQIKADVEEIPRLEGEWAESLLTLRGAVVLSVDACHDVVLRSSVFAGEERLSPADSAERCALPS